MSKGNRRTHARSARQHPSIQSPGGHRQERLEHILYAELEALLREAHDPELAQVKLLSVQLSPDGGHARVAYAAVAGAEREARQACTAALERATGYFRARLASQLELKKVPRLTFTFVGVSLEGGAP